MDLKAKLNIKQLVSHRNIAELLDDDDLEVIAKNVMHEYNLDVESRSEWEEMNAEAIKLALQIAEEKMTPWPGAANVVFPAITIAAMQSQAREYPALIFGSEIAKCRVIGTDTDGTKTARALRISKHMSFQIMEESPAWSEEMDRVLLIKAILGTAFKKVYFDSYQRVIVSEMVLAEDLVIPYHAKSLATASRITHRIPFDKNMIQSRVADGIFLDCIDTERPKVPQDSSTPLQEVHNQLTGEQPAYGDNDSPIYILEQHRFLDLDGDGYAEPYIVTIDPQTQNILRIAPRFFSDSILRKGDKIVHIKPIQYFVKYGMMPSPDGGIYDIGFGRLLGHINRSINTILRQLLDAGTLANMGGGFLGRGARLRKGQTQFIPGQWVNVDGSGPDLKNSIVEVPVREPSNVLYTLLTLLIGYSERITGATELMTGKNIGQNTPATTAQEMVHQGSMIFSAIFKRTYASFKAELDMYYEMNRLFLKSMKSYEELTTGIAPLIMPDDYTKDTTSVKPAADPNIASADKRLEKAMFLKTQAMSGPGYKHPAVERRLLEAAEIPNIDEIWDQSLPPMPHPKVMVEQMKAQAIMARVNAEMKVKLLTLQLEATKTKAEILELEARATKELAEAKGVDTGHSIAMINAQIAAAKIKQEGLLEVAKIVNQSLAELPKEGEMNGQGGIPNAMQPGGMESMAPASSDIGSAPLSSVY